MCGRFTLAQPSKVVQNYFHLKADLTITSHYNIAPSQNILVVRQLSKEMPSFAWHHWGFIPHWMKKDKHPSGWINARIETAASKPVFRQAFQRQRCLIVADGFYEWQKQGRSKQPYYIHPKDTPLFAFAGIWDCWQDEAGHLIESCAILTMEANDLLKPIHERMPVIITPSQFDVWLAPERSIKLNDLSIYPDSAMATYPVGLQVNKTGYDAPDCIMPINDEN
jgi:putative SOS response-associated peptidase YedK